jgi:hypothetical protein
MEFSTRTENETNVNTKPKVSFVWITILIYSTPERIEYSFDEIKTDYLFEFFLFEHSEIEATLRHCNRQ